MARNCIRRETRFILALWAVQDGRCFHCGEPMCRNQDPNYSGRRGVTREHVLPKSSEGFGLHMNIVLACYGCNNGRSDQPLPAGAIERARNIIAEAALRVGTLRPIELRAAAPRPWRAPAQYGRFAPTLADVWPSP